MEDARHEPAFLFPGVHGETKEGGKKDRDPLGTDPNTCVQPLKCVPVEAFIHDLRSPTQHCNGRLEKHRALQPGGNENLLSWVPGPRNKLQSWRSGPRARPAQLCTHHILRADSSPGSWALWVLRSMWSLLQVAALNSTMVLVLTDFLFTLYKKKRILQGQNGPSGWFVFRIFNMDDFNLALTGFKVPGLGSLVFFPGTTIRLEILQQVCSRDF